MCKVQLDLEAKVQMFPVKLPMTIDKDMDMMMIIPNVSMPRPKVDKWTKNIGLLSEMTKRRFQDWSCLPDDEYSIFIFKLCTEKDHLDC